jgi:hypothetical protein
MVRRDPPRNHVHLGIPPRRGAPAPAAASRQQGAGLDLAQEVAHGEELDAVLGRLFPRAGEDDETPAEAGELADRAQAAQNRVTHHLARFHL